jgi:hypothetical protein
VFLRSLHKFQTFASGLDIIKRLILVHIVQKNGWDPKLFCSKELIYFKHYMFMKVFGIKKVKRSLCRPGQVLRVPGS